MRFKNTYFFLLVVIFLVTCDTVFSKRAIGLSGRGRGGSKSSPFGRRKTSSPNDNPSAPKPAPAPKHDAKPSAPQESYVKKETSHVQQSSPNSPKTNQPQPPIGWNVPGHNNAPSGISSSNSRGDFRSGYQTNSAPPAYSPSANQGGGFRSGYQTNSAPPVYSPSANQGGGFRSGYQTNSAPPAYSPSANNQGGGFRSGYQTNQAPPAYSPAGGYHPNYGAAPPSYGGHPSYGAPPAYSPHGAQYGGFGGGYGGYPHQAGGYHSPGMGMGGMGPMGMGMGMGTGGFGNGHMGGYGGGFGGHGSYGGYPMKKSGGLFSGSTVRNLLIGYVAYKAISGVGSLLFHRSYSVYNYYNMPPDMKVPEKIELPSNILTLCDANVTSFCPPETISVCTSNGTIICAATMDQRSPCQDNATMLCVNTTIPCTEPNDPLCQNSTQKEQLKAVVDMPCLTNLTLDVNLLDKQSTTPNTNYVYCVTSMAISGPEYKVCPDLGDITNDYRSVLNENYQWWLEQDGFRRNYTVYNFNHTMETNGDIHMPLNVLTNCSTNATRLCAPNTTTICTTYNEIMCLAPLTATEECTEEDNTMCIQSKVVCTPNVDEDPICKDEKEFLEAIGDDEKYIELDIPCFVNITINSPTPNFNLTEFNGTLSSQLLNSSYTFHFNYCVVTVALPSTDEICITEETKKFHDKKND